jgi:hypothetical protein
MIDECAASHVSIVLGTDDETGTYRLTTDGLVSDKTRTTRLGT